MRYSLLLALLLWSLPATSKIPFMFIPNNNADAPNLWLLLGGDITNKGTNTHTTGSASLTFQTTDSLPCAGFNGTNGQSQVRVTNNETTLSLGTGDYTFETWVYPNTLTSTPYMMDYRPTSTQTSNFPALRIMSGGTVRLATISGGAQVTRLETTAAVTTGAWNHIALVRSGGVHKIYVNGVGSSAYSTAETFTVTAGTERPMFGASGWSGNNVLDGCLRDTKIWLGKARYLADFTPSGGSSPSPYQGPGDVVASASYWYGLRGYSAAYASSGTNPAATIRRASDNATTDIAILTNGNFDVATASTFCASTTCYVTKLFDQTGGGLHVTQATAANQPQLVFNCIGSLPCMGHNGSDQYLQVTTAPNIPVPFTLSGVAKRTGNTSATATIMTSTQSGGGGAGLTFQVANTMRLYNNTACCALTANDNVFHAAQGVYNGASSVMEVDGVSATGDPGSASSMTTVMIGNNQNSSDLTGNITEAGLWPVAFSPAERTNMNSNQHSYWGF